MMFYGYHGVLQEETSLGQRFIVDLSLSLDLSKAGRTDNVKDTVNYAEVYTLVRRIVEGEPKKLLEALAEDICKQLLREFSLVYECTVNVIKPDPPIPGYYKAVNVIITRSRHGK